MIAARLKQCLAMLRWRDIDLADASGRAISDVRAWLDGRQRPPLIVAAWLEALVKAHHSVPPLRSAMSISEKPFRAGEALQIAGPTTQERRKPVNTKSSNIRLPSSSALVCHERSTPSWKPMHSQRVAAVKQKYRSCDGTQSLQAALAGQIESETAAIVIRSSARSLNARRGYYDQDEPCASRLPAEAIVR